MRMLLSGWKECESGLLKEKDVGRIPDSGGSYILIGELTEDKNFEFQTYGVFRLMKGFYYYCGNARGKGGLRARIGRHIACEKHYHWHIDYLRPFLDLICVRWCRDEEMNECRYISMLSSIKSVAHPIKKFGASDCTRSCFSHLVYSLELLSFQSIKEKLKHTQIDLQETRLNGNLIESSR